MFGLTGEKKDKKGIKLTINLIFLTLNLVFFFHDGYVNLKNRKHVFYIFALD